MNNYAPIKMNARGLQLRQEVELAFTQLEDKLADMLKEYGREWALVKTHLQTASMFANRAIALDNQETPEFQSDNAQ